VKRIELPKSIRILHRDYLVQYFPEDGDHGCDGICEFRIGRISIVTTLSNDLIFETLIHEIGHAVNYAADIDDPSTEEEQVHRTTPIWMQVWRDNPELLNLLQRYCEGKL
jgi:hypothetical protein